MATATAEVEVTVLVNNVYSDGEVVERQTVMVQPPDADLDAWAEQWLFPLTGTGRRNSGDASYEVTVIRSAAAPGVEGRRFTWC